MTAGHREQAMRQDEDGGAAQSGEKRRAAIDRSRQHRGQDHYQDQIEGRLLRQPPAITQPDQDQSHGADHQPAQTDLHKSERLRFQPETQCGAE